MVLVDTHCHLQFEKLREQEDRVLAEATKSKVERIICVGTTLADSKMAADIAKRCKNVWAAVGTHPHDAAGFLADINAAKKLKKLAVGSRVVAVGETGLDYYRQLSSKKEQQSALRTHIEIGLELGLPFIFHVRDAWEDFWPILDTYESAGQRMRGVVHSFSSNSEQLSKVLARGLYVGLNGIMTFTKEQEQLEAARSVPMNRLLLETDAPFLTPAPFRGELCEPKHTLAIANFLSKLREESLEDLAAATTANAERLFGLSSSE